GSGSPSPFTIVERGGRPVTEHDGAVNGAGTVLGTYLHGLFVNDGLRGALLGALAQKKGIDAHPRWGAPRADPAERLADAVARAVDLTAVAKLVGLSFPRPSVPTPRRRSRCCSLLPSTSRSAIRRVATTPSPGSAGCSPRAAACSAAARRRRSSPAALH